MRNTGWLFLVAALWVTAADAAPTWHALLSAPTSVRIDGLHFLNTNLGWVGTGDGRILRTADGGTSWQLQFEDQALYFRCIHFADTQDGWAGTLASNKLLYRTTNGGADWSLVANIPEPRPNALCGMWAASSQMIVGVGSYAGPARMIKSIDGGATWTSKDLAPLANTIVDVYFRSTTEGFAVGGVGTFPDLIHSVVLHTTDGGDTWQQVYLGSRFAEWGWKISFSTPLVGYVSLERTEAPMFLLKTVDGGLNWSELPFPDYNEQGIGFATPSIGWVGGASNPTFGTTDGGATWTETPWGSYLDRFQFLSPTLGYGSGVTVYKYSDEVVAVGDQPRPGRGTLAAPNPFVAHTTIRFALPAAGPVRLLIADPAGRVVRTLADGPMGPGAHVVEWDGNNDHGGPAPTGIYLYVLHAGEQHEMGKLVRVR